MMLEEGLLEVKPEAIFGLHLRAEVNVGKISYRSGPIMAGSDHFHIKVTGRSTHGARPWNGVDPIVERRRSCWASRRSTPTDGRDAHAGGRDGRLIKGGIRFNIIPDSVELDGTVRTFDAEMRRETLERIERIATQIAAAAAGATATVEPDDEPNKPVVNDPALTARMLPTLKRTAPPDGLVRAAVLDGGGGLFVLLRRGPDAVRFRGQHGRGPRRSHGAEQPLANVPYRSEILDIGLRTLLGLALDYLQGGSG